MNWNRLSLSLGSGCESDNAGHFAAASGEVCFSMTKRENKRVDARNLILRINGKIVVMISKFDFFFFSIEQTGCFVGTFKKRLRPRVCNETSSGWQGKKNSKKATQVGIKNIQSACILPTDRRHWQCISIWQIMRIFCWENGPAVSSEVFAAERLMGNLAVSWDLGCSGWLQCSAT